MKIALIGDGKTGGHVKKLLDEKDLMVFNEDHKPTAGKLNKADAAIIFVPGVAAGELIEPILESKIPTAWGTTGYQWPEDMPEKVKAYGARWVVASNFSLGMNIMRKCLEAVGQGSELLKDPEFHIHEIHHKDKLDAPSGTALKWKEWLGRDDVQISWNREGDVKGVHSLHVKTAAESLFLKHEAHDRAVFAQGAIWAANYLFNNPNIMPGMYSFESIIDQAFANPS
jgi:4-hydroxy-tetrahydrodipicolinate reductase